MVRVWLSDGDGRVSSRLMMHAQVEKAKFATRGSFSWFGVCQSAADAARYGVVPEIVVDL